MSLSPRNWSQARGMRCAVTLSRRRDVYKRQVNHRMKEMLNKKSLRYNWHEADVTVLEGVLARGDRKVAAVIEEAYRQGAIYDSWSEYFNNDIWMKAFETCGVDKMCIRDRFSGDACGRPV